jgi:hypothetical protein
VSGILFIHPLECVTDVCLLYDMVGSIIIGYIAVSFLRTKKIEYFHCFFYVYFGGSFVRNILLAQYLSVTTFSKIY